MTHIHKKGLLFEKSAVDQESLVTMVVVVVVVVVVVKRNVYTI